jgi:hypothetical protein
MEFCSSETTRPYERMDTSRLVSHRGAPSEPFIALAAPTGILEPPAVPAEARLKWGSRHCKRWLNFRGLTAPTPRQCRGDDIVGMGTHLKQQCGKHNPWTIASIAMADGECHAISGRYREILPHLGQAELW